VKGNGWNNLMGRVKQVGNGLNWGCGYKLGRFKILGIWT
jgi:hypothetical protein